MIRLMNSGKYFILINVLHGDDRETKWLNGKILGSFLKLLKKNRIGKNSGTVG